MARGAGLASRLCYVAGVGNTLTKWHLPYSRNRQFARARRVIGNCRQH